MKKNIPDSERARKTLYVTGFNPKHTSKQLLEELFTQGGPVRDITLFDTHAYVLFEHEESVPYCLALLNEVELHGNKLRLNPRVKSANAFCYLKYLSTVRKKLMAEYRKVPPPDLPPKKMPVQKRYEPILKGKSRNQPKKSNKHNSKTPEKINPKKSNQSPSNKSPPNKPDKRSSNKPNHPPPAKSSKNLPKRSNKNPPKRSNKRSQRESSRPPPKKSGKSAPRKSSRLPARKSVKHDSRKTKKTVGKSRKA